MAADRQYASAIKILQTLKARDDATSSTSSNSLQPGSSAIASRQGPSRLLAPVSQTPVLDYLEHAFEQRSTLLGKFIQAYRRISGRRSSLGSEDPAQAANQHDAQDLMTKIVRNKYLRMSSNNLKSAESKKQKALALAVERLEKAYSLGKADAGLMLADLSLVSW